MLTIASTDKFGTKPLLETLGVGSSVPVWRGMAPYVNLDNAATTPPLKRVQRAVLAAMEWYGSVHRGSGFQSVISTNLLERAYAKVLDFSGAKKDDFALFTSNSTSALNVLARRFERIFGSNYPIVVSASEHSSNLLPWRKHGQVHTCSVDLMGDWDLDELESLILKTKARAVSVTAASNVTGRVLDVGRIGQLAHKHGAVLVVDASQFVAHRSLRTEQGRTEWDFVVFAGHKMYAPYGIGVLISPRRYFAGDWPDRPGGGTIHMLDESEIVWADLPEREEGGTPNYPGMIALAEACAALEDVGYDLIGKHERKLILHARSAFENVDGITVHRPLTDEPNWLAVFPFTISGFYHGLVAAFLGMEKGIAVRSGHLCQYELARKLSGIQEADRLRILKEVNEGDLRNMYGIVRASAGPTTTTAEIDSLKEALIELVKIGPNAKYTQDADGRFRIEDWKVSAPSELNFSW